MKPYIIGICGASCSGKTFISNYLNSELSMKTPSNGIVIVGQDNYYFGGGPDRNYDEPAAIDFNLMTDNIRDILAGKTVETPIYDFVTHSRKKETRTISPHQIIIIEGTLIFTQPELVSLFDLKIFVEAKLSTQIFRRLMRDINQRGRTPEEVWERYERDVGPGFDKYILPSARYADIIVNNTNTGIYIGLQIIINHIKSVFGW